MPFYVAADTPDFDFWWRGFQCQSGQPYLCWVEAYMLQVGNG